MSKLLLFGLGFLLFVNVLPGITAACTAFIAAVNVNGVLATGLGFTFCKLFSGIG